MKKIVLSGLLALLLIVASISFPAAIAKQDNPGPPDIQQKIFIHFQKGKGELRSSGEKGYYKLIGAKWKSFPVHLEVNPSNPSGLTEDFIITAIHVAAEEWDDGLYSNWGGVAPNLFADTITINYAIGYNDLAWTSDKLDGKNTLLWGDYPTEGAIAVTILWYNVKTKTIIEFDIVFDTDYTWGNATTDQSVMDLQNIATHELGHGAGLDDVYQSAAYQETMFGYSYTGEVTKRDLYIGDKKGITKLYGAA